LLARFDSEGKFESVFKPKPIEISENANNFFDKTKTWDLSVLKTKQEFENLSKAIGVTDDSLKKFLTTEDEAYKTKDLATYTKYLNDHNKTLDLATLKTKAWAFAKNMAVNAAIGLAMYGVNLLIKQFDKWIVTTEESREALANLKSECQTIESDLKATNDELEVTRQRMDELEGKGTLTFTEKEEYDNLVKQNNELQRTIDLLKLEQKEKNKEKNKTFVETMEKDVEQHGEYHVSDYGGKVKKGHGGRDIGMNTDEKAYINQQFKDYQDNLAKMAELDAQYKDDLGNKQYQKDRKRLEDQNKKISEYLRGKNTEFTTDADGIEYIENPSNDDEEKVNKWLDFINDFQDKMAIAMGGDNAETNAFNRVVDNWQFDEVVQGLQDLGKEGKVTADMLNDPKYDEFIQKLVYLGIIDSADNLDEIALAFNNVGTEAENSDEKVNKMTVSLEDLTSASEGVSTLQKAFKELSDEGYITTESISKIQEATGLAGEEWSSYQSKLLNAKAGTAEFNQVMTDLTYKILDNTFAGKGLTEVTEEQIAAVLRENGVTNASAVAHNYATRAKIHAKLATFDFSNATKEEIETLYEEMRTMGLTEGAIQSLSSAYASAQTAMLEAVSSGAIARLGVLQSELEGVKSLAEAYALLAGSGGYDSNNDGTVDYVGSEKSRMSGDTKTKYLADREKVLAYGRAVEALENIKSINIAGADVVPKYSGGKSGSSGGGGSKKNDALDNYLKDAENRYKVHQDETKYIKELQYAHDNLTKNDKERLDIIGKINEAYRDLADNRIKDLEHQIDLTKELKGENADVTAQYNEIQRVAHEEAERLRAMGYDDNSNEIQDLQKTWWDAQDKKLDWRWNNSTNWIEERKAKGDWSLFGDSEVQAWERVVKWLEQDYPNALDKIKEAKNNLVDARWEHSNNWIDERNTYNDWALFNDSEVDAWERVVKWLKKDYPDDINKIKEAEQNLFEARKEQFDKANDFGSSILDSQKTLLQSYYDVTNSIAEAQHEINKELETSKTMYEWLDKDTRQLLFNQTDYNTLSEELYDIQYKADKLRRQYERDLNNSTLETVESITSQYEMQYETLMKSYEIAKADLEIAKKKQKLNNVLNERNVRMFINGQWQWVANTEDVINAKAELADAEYAKQVEEAGLTQQESINNLTKQQDELSVVIKKFENGVITLGEAVDAARNAIGNLPNALNSMYNNASSGGTSKSSNRVSRLHPSVVGGSSYSTKIPNVQGNYTVNGVQYRNKYAEGTRYTSGGMTLMGEEGFEAYISSNGHLIPINQPTIGNIPSGGIVFNTEQMSNLRSLWDMSNFNINPDRSYINTQPQQINQTHDNRIIINGMTVDSGSSDGQALISALRRYVGNH